MAFGDGPCLTELPAGFRFCPTDLELTTFYLEKKVSFRSVPGEDIKEIDADEFYSSSPGAIVDFRRGKEKEWYFFIHCSHQNQENLRTEQEGEVVRTIRKDRIEITEEFQKQEENGKIRVVGDRIGYWKSSGKKELIHNATGRAYAFKIRFTYFSGSPNGGKQTHWRLEEYRLIASDGSRIVGVGGDGHHDYGGDETRNSKVYNLRSIEDWALVRITRGRDYASFI